MEGKALKQFLQDIAALSAISLFAMSVVYWAEIAITINLISEVAR